MADLRNDATSIFDSAVSSALPSSLINKKIQRLDDSLIINNKNYTLNRNVKVVAFGKASVDFSKKSCVLSFVYSFKKMFKKFAEEPNVYF